ncbi:unnamed protein product [Fusarium fujikuroi]|nr:unnamed protein product [Fusarium fujikuroi]
MTKSQEDDHSTPSSEQVEKAEHGGTPPLDVNYNTHAVKGDDSDGVVDWTWRHAVASISLAGLYVGAQIPLYFVGGSLTYIVKDIGSSEKSSWLPIANTLTIAVVAPFVGYLQDLFGRRYISLAGGVTILIGVILVGTTHTFGQAVVGMSLAGAGAAVGELTALAGFVFSSLPLIGTHADFR